MIWLVFFNHLEKYEFVNGKDDIPYMDFFSNVPNHQPEFQRTLHGPLPAYTAER